MITVFGSLMGPEELEEIRTSLEAQWTGIGPKTAAFEKQFAERLKLPGFLLLDSGSNSLYLAVKLLDLPPGSDVIVPSFTWIACAHAVVLAGHRPVFADVDLETFNITRATVEAARTKGTRAVMVVHYGGLPVRLDEILPLGLPVVEDAAHAVDSALQGRACGGIGDVGMYSFDAVKNLAMGEGGGLTAKDSARLIRARQLRFCGVGSSGFAASSSKDRWWEYDVTDFFPKMLPSDIAASIGLAQLRKLDRMQAYRRSIWELYQREFAPLGWLARPQDAPADARHSYFTYCVRVGGGRRDAFAKYLYERGIYTTLRYHPLHMNKIYGSAANLPVCARLNDEALSLPIHPGLKEGDLTKIVDTVRAWKG
ncbi:MAG: DegT/DnrJ/EryC1/StrS family aminotransferase [Alphaproteobacteria bacterium]